MKHLKFRQCLLTLLLSLSTAAVVTAAEMPARDMAVQAPKRTAREAHQTFAETPRPEQQLRKEHSHDFQAEKARQRYERRLAEIISIQDAGERRRAFEALKAENQRHFQHRAEKRQERRELRQDLRETRQDARKQRQQHRQERRN